MLIDEVMKQPEAWRDEIKKIREMSVPLVLFGAGSTSEFNLQFFRGLGIQPTAFCDNAPDKVGKKVLDIEILSFAKVRELYPNAYFYITTQLYFMEIKNQIVEGGYNEEQISHYDIIFQLQWEEDCLKYYSEHALEVERLFQSLADEQSQKVLKHRLMFLRTRDRQLLLEIRDGKQYFDNELIDYSKIENFLDLGTYTGDTVLDYIEEAKENHGTIYGFEPDRELYTKAQECLKEFDNIVLIQKGVSDFDGRVKVSQTLGVMQTIEEGVFGEGENEESYFEVCRLDSYFSGNLLANGMIKLDIEGAEMAALRGAEDCIKKNKPIIAVCVYHKQEDILEIPKYCRSLDAKYKVYLRHYSDTQTETVCYLIP